MVGYREGVMDFGQVTAGERMIMKVAIRSTIHNEKQLLKMISKEYNEKGLLLNYTMKKLVVFSFLKTRLRNYLVFSR
jgi:hypothetical protein